MFKWIVFAPARPAAFAFALIGALAVIGTGSNSVAEEKKAAPPAKKKEAPKGSGEATAGSAAGHSRSAATDLLALDQVLPEGERGERQAGLFHRQGRPG